VQRVQRRDGGRDGKTIEAERLKTIEDVVRILVSVAEARTLVRLWLCESVTQCDELARIVCTKRRREC
jgi:hypothetical protein